MYYVKVKGIKREKMDISVAMRLAATAGTAGVPLTFTLYDSPGQEKDPNPGGAFPRVYYKK